MSYPSLAAAKPPFPPQQQQPQPAGPPQNPQMQQAPPQAPPPPPQQAAMPAAPAMVAAPPPPQPQQSPATMPMEDPIGQLRSEIAARFQALEQTIAQMAQKPGEAPEEQQLRSEAAQLDEQANTLRAEALAHIERANALTTQVMTLRAGGDGAKGLAEKPVADVVGEQPATKGETQALGKKTQVDVLSDEAKKEVDAAAEKDAQAVQLAAQAAEKRAKAYGIWPFIQATAALITDHATKTNKLITDLGTKISDYGKLSTERSVSTQNGGKASDIDTGGGHKTVSADAAPETPVRLAAGLVAPPEPQRRSMTLSAAAQSLVSKYGDADAGGALSTVALDDALTKAGVTNTQQRMALKVELGNLGYVR